MTVEIFYPGIFDSNWWYFMHLSSASPRGGPRADVGEYGDFMGTLQQISALVVGEM